MFIIQCINCDKPYKIECVDDIKRFIYSTSTWNCCGDYTGEYVSFECPTCSNKLEWQDE